MTIICRRKCGKTHNKHTHTNTTNRAAKLCVRVCNLNNKDRTTTTKNYNSSGGVGAAIAMPTSNNNNQSKTVKSQQQQACDKQ